MEDLLLLLLTWVPGSVLPTSPDTFLLDDTGLDAPWLSPNSDPDVEPEPLPAFLSPLLRDFVHFW
jgi:hypothetical protein